MIVRFKAPLRLPKNNKGDMVPLNLNAYRNLHYQTSNKLKKKYKELWDFTKCPEFKTISLRLKFFPKDKRRYDLDNVCSVHTKFFLDALVEAGRLPDDDYRYVNHITYEFGEIDKNNPRMEIYIHED